MYLYMCTSIIYTNVVVSITLSPLHREVNAHSLVWQSQLNLGEMLVQRNKPGRALVAYKESLHHAMASNNKQQKADSLMQIAMVRM